MFDWINSNAPAVAAIAAIFSAIATGFAVLATWRGPVAAANLAEKMRQKAEVSNEKRRLKLYVFTTLLQERAAYYSLEAVRAFNLIDFVFNESRNVRRAWEDFLSALDPNNSVPEHAVKEKFRKLLSAIADDVGLADELRADDLNRIYYPTALLEEEHIKRLQREHTLRQLTAETSPSANTAAPIIASDFPPPPSKP